MGGLTGKLFTCGFLVLALILLPWAAVTRRWVLNLARNARPERVAVAPVLAGQCSYGYPARIRKAMRLMSKIVPGQLNCLTLGLVAELLLRIANCPSLLTIGVQIQADGQFRSHAWVSSGGAPVVGVSGAGGFEAIWQRSGETEAKQ